MSLVKFASDSLRAAVTSLQNRFYNLCMDKQKSWWPQLRLKGLGCCLKAFNQSTISKYIEQELLFQLSCFAMVNIILKNLNTADRNRPTPQPIQKIDQVILPDYLSLNLKASCLVVISDHKNRWDLPLQNVIRPSIFDIS